MSKKNIYIVLIIIFIILLIIGYSSFGSIKAEAIEKKVYDSNTVYVDIKGAVNKPGVYEINSNSRIIDVIKKAGNLKKEADTSIINLSKKVKDEMYIIIYTKEEVQKYKEMTIPSSKVVEEINEKIICPDPDNDACANKTNVSTGNKININTATVSELSTLSGIGESKAKKIIKYREKQKFNSIEDIKNVEGIGDSLYEKIKDNIEV